MATRNLGQIIEDAVNFIQSKIPGLSLLAGTVARDVVVESPAQEFERANIELDRIQRQQTLTDVTAFTDDELEGRAEGIGLERTDGIEATGTVVFRLSTFDTTSDDVVFPVGTQVSTTASSTNPDVVTFATTATRIFAASQADTYFNSTTGFFELTAPIQALETGATSNVAARTITQIVTSIDGNPIVTNTLPTSGGTDDESNEDLLERIRLKLAGNNVGTANGILSIVRENSAVVDSILIRPGDPELTRDQFGNASDVVIIGETLTEVEESRDFNAGVSEYILNRQPVSESDDAVGDIIQGTSADTGLSFDFIKDTHFVVSRDTSSITRGTTAATTKIVFLGSPFPANDSTFSVAYTINSLIADLQTTLDSDDNKIIGTDIKIREAVKVLIRVSAQITVLPGFTQADVAAEAATNVADFLNSLTLGTDVDESDIVAIIQTTAGVDSVDLDTLVLEEKRPTDSVFSVVSDSVVITRTEYGRPDTAAGAITII